MKQTISPLTRRALIAIPCLSISLSAARSYTGPAFEQLRQSAGPQQASETPLPDAAAIKTAGDNQPFVFKAETDEVALPVAVMDERGELVKDLDEGAFTVYENGKPQKIASFRPEDAPISLGILIDSSGSMKNKQAAVGRAARILFRANNPLDRVFLADMNDDWQVDQDFTSDIGLLELALRKIKPAGKTTLYDSVALASRALDKSPLARKALVVVTDGLDNESMTPLEGAIESVQSQGGPVVYAVGLLYDSNPEDRNPAMKALLALTTETGGMAFFPNGLDDVDRIARTIAGDIRTRYVIHYKPSIPLKRGGYREVRVEARAPGRGKLTARTRAGYQAASE